MMISTATFRVCDVTCQRPRVCSKKSVQQGRSHFCARSVLVLREHGTRARTPLAAFFNRPISNSSVYGNRTFLSKERQQRVGK